jgi:hypothetical protein
MSTIVANSISSTPWYTTAQDLVLETSGVERLRVNASTGNITIGSSLAISAALTATSFNGYTPVNRAGDTMTGTLATTAPAVLQVAGQTVYNTSNANRRIDRGNPGSGSPLLLSRLDESHLYYGTSITSLAIPTTMVENAVYQLSYSTSGSNPNVDIVIQPNYTTYASQFRTTYFASYPAAPPIYPPPGFIEQVLSNFYFDHQAGGTGITPAGNFIIYNYRAVKLVQYFGGDSLSYASGTGRWNNSTDQWLNIGNLTGFTGGTDVFAIVRRIG